MVTKGKAGALDRGALLDALGDGTRRRILEELRAGPRSVSAIADRLPVSRPAVSKHLRLMKDAGLVIDRARGTQRLYELNSRALVELHAWLDQLWDVALSSFRDAAHRDRERRKR